MKHQVTFQSHTDSLALALAKLGQSDKSIMVRTKLTGGKIAYRLGKAKRIEKNSQGYRVAWRNGSSELVRQVIEDLAGVLQAEIRRDITPQITEVRHD